MKAALLLLAILLGACNGGAEPGKPSPLDAPRGSVPEQECYGTGLVNICFFQPSRAPVSLAGSLTTNDPARCALDREECVILGTTITVGSLEVTGSRPLVLIADTIVVAGTLDASSKRGGKAGPNASPQVCNQPANAIQAGGGAGGSFGGRGGAGGAGLAGEAQAGLAVMPTQFRGGCSGGRGQNAPASAVALGGGAVFLIARTAITIDGAIDASGAGGIAGQANGGGGGGGSGGMIGLDAPLVTIAGSVFANGGGGGEGGAGAAPGLEATDALTPAAGGSGGSGGDGGAGAAGASLDGAPGMASGGGGGGGAGVVMVIPPQPTGGTISPPPQM